MHIRKSLLLLAACQMLSACSDTAELRDALEEAEAERDKLRRELQMRDLEPAKPVCHTTMQYFQDRNGHWVTETGPTFCD